MFLTPATPFCELLFTTQFIGSIFLTISSIISTIIDLARDYVEKRNDDEVAGSYRSAGGGSRAAERNLEQYREEFTQLFPSIMIRLVDEKIEQLPLLKDAYEHLEKVAMLC